MADGTILPRTAESDVSQAVLQALRADADVQAVFGIPARIFDVDARRNIYPYALLERHETRPAGSAGVAGTEHIITFSIASRFGGRRYARDALGALRAAIERADLVVEGQRVVLAYASYGDVFRTQDRQTLRGVLRIRIVSEEMV